MMSQRRIRENRQIQGHYLSPDMNSNTNENEQELDDLELAIEISKKEQQENTIISQFIHDRSKLMNVLSQLPGVDITDPRFEQFLT